MPRAGETKGENRFSERVNIPVTLAVFEALKKRAKRLGRSQTEQARMILTEALAPDIKK